MRGRTIMIAINIDGPAWTRDGSIDQEMHHLLEHVEASIHMWDQPGPNGQQPWQPRILIGTDRMPTGKMWLEFDRKIDGLPERSEVEGAYRDAIEEAMKRLKIEAEHIVHAPSERRHRRRFRSDAEGKALPGPKKAQVISPEETKRLPLAKSKRATKRQPRSKG